MSLTLTFMLTLEMESKSRKAEKRNSSRCLKFLFIFPSGKCLSLWLCIHFQLFPVCHYHQPKRKLPTSYNPARQCHLEKGSSGRILSCESCILINYLIDPTMPMRSTLIEGFKSSLSLWGLVLNYITWYSVSDGGV